jgi:L-cystine uptake protein TcyP (sodium:dicarboxylate symporter family)
MLTGAMITLFNTPLFVDTFGVLDPTGKASSAIVVPPGEIPAAMVGLDISLAHLIFDMSGTALEVSNVTTTRIVP